jgi:hydrogenase maturation protease
MCPSNQIPRGLVIGFGNLDRGDDGAAFHVVNRLRARMGRRLLEEGNSGLEELGSQTAVFVRQLVPELSADIGGYDRLVLVDAHIPQDRRPLRCRRVRPEPWRSAFSHVLSPASFLWLVQTICGRVPEAFVVSLRGQEFAPGRDLSAPTAGLVGPAADAIWRLLFSRLEAYSAEVAADSAKAALGCDGQVATKAGSRSYSYPIHPTKGGQS